MPFKVSEYLTKNHILYPGLFPNQGLPPNERFGGTNPAATRSYAIDLCKDMWELGIHLESWTETEGGRWLPANYLKTLKDTYYLWDMTRVHSLLFNYPGKGELRWDNITGLDPNFLSWGKTHIDKTRYDHRHIKGKSMEDSTVSVNGLEFFVEYTIESHGCGPTMPSWNYAGDPGESPEVTIWNITTEVGNGEVVVIHEDKGFTSLVEKIEQEVVQYVAESAVDDWSDDGDY